MTTRAEPAPTPPRTRRALLAGALGGIAAWAAAAAARADPAAAAAGDPIRMGQLNKARGTSTTLQSATRAPTLRVLQLGHGHSAVKAEATTGRAVWAVAGHDGTGVEAYSPDLRAVWARSDSGVAVEAHTHTGTAVNARGGTALRTFGAVEFDGGIVSVATYPFRAHNVIELMHTIPTDAFEHSDRARLFARDSGSGKTQLCVLFDNGEIQVLATQS